MYVRAGHVRCDINGLEHVLTTGSFAYMKPGSRFMVTADTAAHLLWLKKRFVPVGNARPYDLVGNEQKLPGETYRGHEGLLLKTILPVDTAWGLWTFTGCILISLWVSWRTDRATTGD